MNQIVVLQTWFYRFDENMFYGKMESRNEDIVFPARAGHNSQKLPHYAVVCLMRQSVFAA